MTENEYAVVMSGGGGRETIDGRNRLRYIVADAISDYAKEVGQIGRRDQAGLLRYIEGEVRYGSVPSKKSTRKAAKLLRVVESRVVDGISVSGI